MNRFPLPLRKPTQCVCRQLCLLSNKCLGPTHLEAYNCKTQQSRYYYSSLKRGIYIFDKSSLIVVGRLPKSLCNTGHRSHYCPSRTVDSRQLHIRTLGKCARTLCAQANFRSARVLATAVSVMDAPRPQVADAADIVGTSAIAHKSVLMRSIDFQS